MPVKELCRKHGFSDASFYTWRSKFGGMEVPDAKRLKAIAQENDRLQKLLAETMLDEEALEAALEKSTDPTGEARSGHRDASRHGALRASRLSACGVITSRLRYEPRRS